MSREKQFLSKLIQLIRTLFNIAIRQVLDLIKSLYKLVLRKLRFSITFKLTTVYAINFTLILMILSALSIGGFIGYLGKVTKDSIEKDFNMTSYYIRNNKENSYHDINKIINNENTYINIFDKNKKLIYTTSSMKSKSNSSIVFYQEDELEGYYFINDNYIFIKNNYGQYSEKTPFRDSGATNCLVFTEKLKLNEEYVYVQTIYTLDQEMLIIKSIFMVVLIIDITSILIIITIGSRYSRKMLIPIDKMISTVKNISANDLDTRLDVVKSYDELKDLAETFNDMLDRIQCSYENQRQFASDASHELRTPIAVIQGYANLLDRWGKDNNEVLEESIEAIKSESENMKDLIEKLLFLARGDKGTQKLEKKNFYINELIDEIIKETRLIDATHEIINENNEMIEINADPKLIKEALRIFIDNSIKYTQDGGKIKINSYLQQNKVMITIEDTGMGIAKEDIPNIFERFYRADKSRTKGTGGTGLGLAISKWIILSHNGNIEVKSVVDVGTKIIVYLPIK